MTVLGSMGPILLDHGTTSDWAGQGLYSRPSVGRKRNLTWGTVEEMGIAIYVQAK